MPANPFSVCLSVCLSVCFFYFVYLNFPFCCCVVFFCNGLRLRPIGSSSSSEENRIQVSFAFSSDLLFQAPFSFVCLYISHGLCSHPELCSLSLFLFFLSHFRKLIRSKWISIEDPIHPQVENGRHLTSSSCLEIAAEFGCVKSVLWKGYLRKYIDIRKRCGVCCSLGFAFFSWSSFVRHLRFFQSVIMSRVFLCASQPCDGYSSLS